MRSPVSRQSNRLTLSVIGEARDGPVSEDSNIPPDMASDENTVKPMVYIALVGFGRAGHMHLSSIRSNHRCRLKYVVELAGESEEAARHELAGLNMSDSVSVIPSDRFDSVVLADPDLNAVMITTPTDQHEEYIFKSISAGKAVFCEKPIAESIDTVQKCYKEAERAKLPLFCAFNRRFDPAFYDLRERVRRGDLGKVHCISTTSRDSPLPSMSYLKISNGMYHDCAVHDIDTVCWILGEEPSHVYAQGHAQKKEIADIDDVDTVVIVLTFPSGVLASVNLSRHSTYGYDQRMEVSLH